MKYSTSPPSYYGEGVPIDPPGKGKYIPGKGNTSYRTDFSQTMEPSRGPRTYPTVRIIEKNKKS